jgi:hypothetical protein
LLLKNIREEGIKKADEYKNLQNNYITTTVRLLRRLFGFGSSWEFFSVSSGAAKITACARPQRRKEKIFSRTN